MIVYSKIEDYRILSNVVDDTIYSKEIDYASISEIIRLLENEEPRKTENDLTRLLE